MEDNDFEELLKTLENPISPDKKFRFQSSMVLLTYKTHVDKILMCDFLNNMFQSKKTGAIPCIKIYIAHENGKNDPLTPYEHSHVVVKFGTKPDRTDPRFLDFNNIHPHIRKIFDKQQWRKACKYVTKEDKSVILDEEDRFSLVQIIQSCKSENEAISKMVDEHGLKAVLPTKLIYQLKEKKQNQVFTYPVKDFFPWQSYIHDRCFEKPDKRKIIWIADKEGNAGKTEFMKSMIVNYPKKVMKFQQIGRTLDFNNLWLLNIENGFEGDTCIFNIPRSKDGDHSSLYECLESIKDGSATSTKYKGGDILCNSMHTIVLSNELPDVSKVSPDRWEVLILENKELKPIHYKRVPTIRQAWIIEAEERKKGKIGDMTKEDYEEERKMHAKFETQKKTFDACRSISPGKILPKDKKDKKDKKEKV